MNMNISNTDKKSINQLVSAFSCANTSERHRYSSWEFCYGLSMCMHERLLNGEVLTTNDYDYMALNLGFYLASWGMLRNSFLLDCSYKIHLNPVEVILGKKSLWQDRIDATTLLNFYESLYGAYGYKDKKESRVSDTLFTKILLGMTGNVVAYDKYCKEALNLLLPDEVYDLFRDKGESWKEICSELHFFDATFSELEYKPGYRKYMYSDGHYCMNDETVEYPTVKLIDMFLFNLGWLRVTLAKLVSSSVTEKTKKKYRGILKKLVENGVEKENTFVEKIVSKDNLDRKIVAAEFAEAGKISKEESEKVFTK